MKTNKFPVTKILFLFLALTPFLAFTTAFAATIRVPSEQATIQAGIDAAVAGDTVLVADGTYTGVGNQNIDFKGKAITVQSENGAANCIVDCVDSSLAGFYFHTGENITSVLSGITVTNGWIGILCSSSSPTITNCTISGNGGTGIYCTSTPCSPTITGCTISGNSGAINGGGIYCDYSSSPTIIKCIIRDNTTTGAGGGIYLHSCLTTTLTNCLITGNTAYSTGGGIYSSSSSSILTNCTISGNTASSSGGVFAFLGFPVIKNSIIYGNTPLGDSTIGSSAIVTYSDIVGYSGAGTGNIDEDPLFAGNGDYRLSSNSPCIDTGTADGAPHTDLAGYSRPQGAGYDMGAYEYVGGGYIRPTANAGSDQRVFDSITLDGSGSTDPDGTIISYLWQLKYQGNSSYDRTATGIDPTVSNLQPGFYDVTLTVTDNQALTDTDTMFFSAIGIKGDFNGDGDVDGSDLQVFSTNYGK